MDDLSILYQQMILDHSRNPRFYGEREDVVEHNCYNPLCGDEIKIYCEITDNKFTHLSFTGAGCAISVASASLMVEALQNSDPEKFKELFRDYNALVKGETLELQIQPAKLEVMQGVSQYPMRVKCATCAWHALEAAIDKCKEKDHNDNN